MDQKYKIKPQIISLNYMSNVNSQKKKKKKNLARINKIIDVVFIEIRVTRTQETRVINIQTRVTR